MGVGTDFLPTPFMPFRPPAVPVKGLSQGGQERETSSKKSSPYSSLPVQQTQKPQYHRHPLNSADLDIITALSFTLPQTSSQLCRSLFPPPMLPLWDLFSVRIINLLASLWKHDKHATHIMYTYGEHTIQQGMFKEWGSFSPGSPANTTCECSSISCQQATYSTPAVCVHVCVCV